MFYRLLGMVVWKAGNWLLRRLCGVTVPQAAAIAAAVLAAGVALGAARRGTRSGQLTP